METYALFNHGSASRLVFDSFSTSPHDDPVRLVFPDIEDMQVRNSARNGCLAAYHVLGDLGYLQRADQFYFSCQFSPPSLNRQVQGNSAGLAFCMKFVQECYSSRAGTRLPYSVAATGVISDATRSAFLEPVTEINAKLESSFGHLRAGDVVLYPMENHREVGDRVRGRAVQLGIRLIPVSSVAQAVEEVLPRVKARAGRRRLKRALAAGLVLLGVASVVEFASHAGRLPHLADVPPAASNTTTTPQADLAARLLGKQGLVLAADFHYVGLNKRGVASLGVAGNSSVHVRYGDRYKLACRASEACYLHIYQIDQKGRVDRLPDPRAEASVPFLQADSTYLFPSALVDWRAVDAVAGLETLYLLAATAPDSTIENLYQQYRLAPEESKTAYSDRLLEALQARTAYLGSEANAISFTFSHDPTEPGTKVEHGANLSLRGDQSGQILFTSLHYGNDDIVRLNTDGQARTDITDHPASETGPAWSPDGARIAFSTDRDGNSEICVMEADGSAERNLTRHPGRDLFPSWSPDGRQIVFQSNRGNTDSENFDLYILEIGGFEVRPLATSSYREQGPSWSPDGQWIAYVRSTTFDDHEIHLIRPDGTADHPFYASVLPLNAVHPAWSPDGTQLAFTGVIPGVPCALFIVDLNTGALTPVALPVDALTPAFAPDGNHLVFAASPANEGPGYTCIYACDVRGRWLQQLTRTRQLDKAPVWSEGFRSLGTAEVGGRAERLLYLDNPGSDTLRVNQVRFSDPQFTAEPEQFTVAPGETQQLGLRFSPVREGTSYATLSMLSNDPDGPEVRLILNGQGGRLPRQPVASLDVRVPAPAGN